MAFRGGGFCHRIGHLPFIAAWVFSMIFSGYFLQKWILASYGFDLKEHLEVIVLVIVLVTTAPVIFKMVAGKTKSNE